MSTVARAWMAMASALLIGQAVGCGPKQPGRDDLPPAAVQRNRSESVDPEATYSASPDGRGPAIVEVADPAADPARRYTVDAMIGQINGRPVYADDLLQEIGSDTLARIGASQPPAQFREQVRNLLAQKIQQKVFDALLLAEAEAALSEQQQSGLLGLLQKFREERLQELIYDGGPRSEAAQQRTIEEQVARDVEERRQELVIQKHLRDKVFPRISVSQREVERYYRANKDEYNPPGKIRIRLILVRDDWKKVEAALAEGRPFEEVAREYSAFRAEVGGLMPTIEARLSGFDELSWPGLNEAIRGLEPGEHTGRVRLEDRSAWAYLESYEPGERRSLNEVWLEIERKLRSQEYQRAQRRYMAELAERGNFTPMDRMLRVAMKVAMNRYARTE